MEDAEGFVGIGAELVGYEPRYADIVGSLLGNVVFATDWKSEQNGGPLPIPLPDRYARRRCR
ncbi:hypothetical protein HMSSN036_71320 [Paenibacillus macerans]|nr:hypothetical protein HMSSN036_71320 [Paenibacillus macerans]